MEYSLLPALYCYFQYLPLLCSFSFALSCFYGYLQFCCQNPEITFQSLKTLSSVNIVTPLKACFANIYNICNTLVTIFLFQFICFVIFFYYYFGSIKKTKSFKKREKGRIRSRKLNFPFVSRKLSLGIYLNEYIYSGRKIDFYRKRKSSYCFDQNGWCLLKTKSFHLFEIFKISTNLSEIYSIISAAKQQVKILMWVALFME